MPISRRRFSRLAFMGALGAATVGGGAAILNYLDPRNHDRRPQRVIVRGGDVPLPGGEPLLNEDHGFYLVNLSAESNAAYGGRAISPGLFALSTACPHIRGECPVRWRSDYSFTSPFTGDSVRGWLTCPCHGSVFTPAGVRAFGPSPRSLDTLEIEKKDGRIIVHLTEITEGGVDQGVEPLAWP